MKRFLALKPLRISGRDVAVGEVVWLGERVAADAVAQGLVREMPAPMLLRAPVTIETKA